MTDKSDNPSPPKPPEQSSAEKSTGGSIGLSEGQRGINVVNTEPVGGVPEPGGLPAAAPSAGDGPAMSATPVEPAAPPPSGE